jgi:hypothetical protein
MFDSILTGAVGSEPAVMQCMMCRCAAGCCEHAAILVHTSISAAGIMSRKTEDLVVAN